MTDTKALIAEARELSNKRKGALDPYQVVAELEEMVDRLADALERAADGLISGSCPTRPD